MPDARNTLDQSRRPSVDGRRPPSVDTDNRRFATAQLRSILQYAREREYTGWDLYDGESSRLLQALPTDNKWVNLAFQQAVRRSPVNLRPLLLVECRQSFLGTGLFALANHTAHELTGDERYRRDARLLTDWLVEHRSTGYSGFCGGHKHPLQGQDHHVPPNEPGIVGTSSAVRALLTVGEQENEPTYRERARSADAFVVEDLAYTDLETHTGARIRYRPGDTDDAYTLNANALGARLFIDLYAAFGDPSYRSRATAILDYVVSRQTDRGGWMYRDPPETSHLSMDSFHNGFILKSLLRHREVCEEDRYADVIDRGVEFYRTLFDIDGTPHLDESRVYPQDVHAAAQGIIVFSMLGEYAAADRILRWTVERLSDGDGRFYHQRRQFFTVRTTLMRWCQGWMAYALATYLRRATGLGDDYVRPVGASTTDENTR